MLRSILWAEAPFSLREYSTRGGISLYWRLSTIRSFTMSLMVAASTASVRPSRFSLISL